MSYFGITEKQRETQLLFEATFNVFFNITFQHIKSNYTYIPTDKEVESIKRVNYLVSKEFLHTILFCRYFQLISTLMPLRNTVHMVRILLDKVILVIGRFHDIFTVLFYASFAVLYRMAELYQLVENMQPE